MLTGRLICCSSLKFGLRRHRGHVYLAYLQNITKFRVVVLGPRPMTLWESHFAEKETAFVFKECFENLRCARLQVLYS